MKSIKNSLGTLVKVLKYQKRYTPALILSLILASFSVI